MQVQELHPHMTVFLTLWAAIGPILGLVVGNFLQSKGQHKQWRRDTARDECRELLGELSITRFSIRDLRHALKRGDEQGRAAMDQYDKDAREFHRIIGSRIVIARELKAARIAARWENAVLEYLGDKNEETLESVYDSLVDDLVEIGLRA
jgi:hypothetical protein